MDPAFTDGAQPGERLHAGLAQTLVTADDRAVVQRHGQHLPVQPALGPRAGGPLLRGEPECVDVLAGEAPPRRDPVGRLVLRRQVHAPPGRAGDAVRPLLPTQVGQQRHLRHDLDPAGEAGRDLAGGDLRGQQVHGLLRRAALRVDRGDAGLPGQPRVQPGVAADVPALLPGLRHAAGEDLLDLPRFDAGALDGGGQHVREDGLGLQAGEHAVPLAERRPHGLDDHRVPHAVSF